MDSIKRRNKLKFQIKDYCSCAEVFECDCTKCQDSGHQDVCRDCNKRFLNGHVTYPTDLWNYYCNDHEPEYIDEDIQCADCDETGWSTKDYMAHDLKLHRSNKGRFVPFKDLPNGHIVETIYGTDKNRFENYFKVFNNTEKRIELLVNRMMNYELGFEVIELGRSSLEAMAQSEGEMTEAEIDEVMQEIYQEWNCGLVRDALHWNFRSNLEEIALYEKDYPCNCVERMSGLTCECDCWNCAEDNEHFPEFNTIGDSN